MDNILSGLRLPVIAAPMFLISDPKLVLECNRNGIIGTFPALNQRTTEGFEEWLIEIQEGLKIPTENSSWSVPTYGVNLIVHKTNPRLQKDLEICVKHKVPLVITSLGAVTEVVDAVHSYGGLVYHDIAYKRHAIKAAQAGVDGIIAVANGAGGHAGTINPFALVAEIRQFFNGTLVLAGCISSGHDVAAALAMGADLAYMGTRFINTRESRAIEDYKELIIESGAEDIVYTPAVSGVPASFLRSSLEKAGYDLKELLKPGNIAFGEKLKPAEEEAKAWKTVWSAGQGVTAIRDIPSVRELVDRLHEEFQASFRKLNKYNGQMTTKE